MKNIDDLRPPPGESYSERKRKLAEGPFGDIRNLATLFYKKPGTNDALLQFNQTFESRENTLEAVLQFELSQGFIVPDGAEAMALPVQMEVPGTQQTQSAPAQSGDAPPATPARGRPRRTIGAAVAPSPAVMNPAQVIQQPNSEGAPPWSPPAPPVMMPQVPNVVIPVGGPPLPFAPIAQQQVQPSGDLSVLIGKLDQIGNGLSLISQNQEAMAKQLTVLGDIIRKQAAALHHIYMTNPSLAPAINGKANDAGSFLNYLEAYAPK